MYDWLADTCLLEFLVQEHTEARSAECLAVSCNRRLVRTGSRSSSVTTEKEDDSVTSQERVVGITGLIVSKSRCLLGMQV